MKLLTKRRNLSIPGTRKLHCLEENIGAAAITLTPDDLDAIDTALWSLRYKEPEGLDKSTMLKAGGISGGDFTYASV